MTARVVDRRRALVGVGAAGLAGVAGGLGPAAAAEAATASANSGRPSTRPRRDLDLSTPEAQLRAYLKLLVSLSPATIFYTYHGTLDAAVPGRGLVPLLRTTSLVRRLVEPQADGWRVTIWEATVYHRAGEDEPAESFESPLNGCTTRPASSTCGTGNGSRRAMPRVRSRVNGSAPATASGPHASRRASMRRARSIRSAGRWNSRGATCSTSRRPPTAVSPPSSPIRP